MADAESQDAEFFQRADRHIDLANEQCRDVGRAKASASFMYALARFNAWVSACGCENAEQMQSTRRQAVEYFVGQYQSMLEENLDDYIANFERYMQSSST